MGPITYYCARCDADVPHRDLDHGADMQPVHAVASCGAPAVVLPDLYALTMWAPWWWAITDLPPHLRKGVENRPWAPYPWVVRRWIVLHASGTWEGSGMQFVVDQLRQAPRPDLWWVTQADDAHHARMHHLVGLVRIDSFWAPRNMFQGGGGPWRMPEQYGWEVGDVIKLDPVPVPRGWNKLWCVPAAPRWRVLQQLRATRPDVIPLLATPRPRDRQPSLLP